MTSKKVLLPDAFWFQEGPGVRKWQFTNSGIKLLNVGNITKEGVIDLSKTDRYLTEEEANGKYKHFLCDEGDLVIASSGISFDDDGLLRTRGAFITKEHLPLCMNTSTIRFKAKKDISELNFLKFWLDSYEFRDQISKQVTGSAQQNFGPMQLRETWITLPPLPEQRRIADLLSRADRLRRLRRVGDSLSASLLQSVFLEMFGNPISNPKGWDMETLEDLADNITYGITASANFNPVGPKFLRITDIQNGTVNWADVPYCEISEKGKRDGALKRGDIVFARTGATTGKSFLIQKCPENAVFASYLIRVRPRKRLNSSYLFGYFQSEHYWAQISESASGSAQPGVNSTKLGELKIPVPPLPQQEQFAAVVRRVESLRGRAGESGRQVEGLFQALLAQSFGV